MSSYTLTATYYEFEFTLLPVGSAWVPSGLAGMSDGQYHLYQQGDLQSSAAYSSYDTGLAPVSDSTHGGKYAFTNLGGGNVRLRINKGATFPIQSLLIYVKDGGTFYRGLVVPAAALYASTTYNAIYLLTGSLPARTRAFEIIGSTRYLFNPGQDLADATGFEWRTVQKVSGVYNFTALGSTNPLSRSYMPSGVYAYSAVFTQPFSPPNDYGVPGLQLRLTNAYGSTTPIAPGFSVDNWPPTARFTVTNASAFNSGSNTYTVDAENVTFDAAASVDLDGSIAAYAWNFGDGNTGSGVNPSHTYTVSGTYTVTLTVTDNDGVGRAVSHLVRVNGALPALALDPHTGSLHYFYVSGGQARVTRNYNQATTWTLQNGVNDFLIESSGATWIYAFRQQDRLYCVYGTSGGVFLKSSTNDGQTWSSAMTIATNVAGVGTNFDEHSGILKTLVKESDGDVQLVRTQVKPGGTLAPIDTVATTGLPAGLTGIGFTGDQDDFQLVAKSGSTVNVYRSQGGVAWT